MNIKPGKFKELIKKGISLDLVWLLQEADKGLNIKELGDGRIMNLINTLERKGFYSNGITEDGKKLLESLETGEEIQLKKLENRDEEFKKWWQAYPATTEFKYKGRMFSGSRALRMKKEECKIKITKIIAEGYSIEELIQALEYEVLRKKEESLRTGDNKLNYMQNSLTYLNQRTFEPYIETMRENNQFKSSNIIDI